MPAKEKKKEKEKEKLDAETLEKRTKEMKKEIEKKKKRMDKIENLLEEKGRGGVFKYLLYEKGKRELSEFEKNSLKNLKKLAERSGLSEEKAKEIPSKKINEKIKEGIEKKKTEKYIR